MLKSLSATDLATMSDRTGALQHSNVFVKHLPNDVASEGAVRELFQPYGPIECVRLVVRPAQLNLMRSFAFVKFSNLEDAAKAIAALDGTELQGSVLEVKTADADAGDRKPELAAPPCDNLYVKNLPVECTQEEVQALFAAHGEVLTIRMLHAPAAAKGGRSSQRHSSSSSDGSTPMGTGALVRMGSVEQACQAVAALHNSRLEGSALPLVVRFADGQEQKLRKAARQQRQVPRQASMRQPRTQQQQLLSGAGQGMSPGTNGLTANSRSRNSSTNSLQGDYRPGPSSNGSSSPRRQPRRNSRLGHPPTPATQERSSDRPGYSPATAAAAAAAAGYGGYLYSGYASYGYANGAAYNMHSPYAAAPVAADSYQQQVWAGYAPHQQQAWNGGYAGAQQWPGYGVVMAPSSGLPPTAAAATPAAAAAAAAAADKDPTPAAAGQPPPAAASAEPSPAAGADANAVPDLSELHIDEPAPPSRSVCVRGLPLTADKLFLYERFGRFGAIFGVQLDTSAAGDTTGYVTFDTPAAATRAAAPAAVPDPLQVTVCPMSDMVQGPWASTGKASQRQHMQQPAGKAATYTTARRGTPATSYDC